MHKKFDLKEVTSKIFVGHEVRDIINEASLFRLKYFEEFPYLYKGNFEYEQEYFLEFSRHPCSYVEVLLLENKVIGIATGTPLKSDSNILKESADLFFANNHSPEDYFYIGEVILAPNFRGHGLATLLLKNAEEFGRSKGYSRFTLATIVREKNDPRTPDNYRSTDSVWIKNSYLRTDLVFKYSWPTIMPNKKVAVMDNEMVFWIK
jgi:ribosomal protein S18 acetylase RimI-like enzyme